MGAGALIFNKKGELLILKPTYKDHWTIPGGVVDTGESPHQACLREIKEEVGLDLQELRFLCVVYHANKNNEKGESLQFVFYGGKLDEKQLAGIRLPPKELSEYRFVDVEEAKTLISEAQCRRLPKCLEAIKNNTAFYLEDNLA